jgi:hypothetical protein
MKYSPSLFVKNIMGVGLNMSTITTLLEDAIDEESNIETEVTIVLTGRGIAISVEGYGDYYSNQGEGIPILLEMYEGRLRLVVWGDINKQDPTQIIDLEHALESQRENT